MRPQSTKKNTRSRAIGRDGIELNLHFKPPYDWPTIIRFYESHRIPGVERITETSLERIFRIENIPGFLQVRAMAGKPHLRLKVVTADPKIFFHVVSRVRRMFDLDCDPVRIVDCFAKVPLLSRLCDRFPGLRLPRGWDAFETAICAILGQLVSAEQRSNLIAQLVSGYGEAISHPISGEMTRLFPGPEVLAKSDLTEIKTSELRREAIREFSRRVLSGAISLSPTQDIKTFRKRLLEIKGLGPWSAEYISLRAIGDTDAFPKTDLILRRALELHPDLDLEAGKPWRSYAATYLWKEFAQTLSKTRRRNEHDSILQRVEIAGRQTQTGSKFESPRRNSLGAGTPKPRKAGQPKARPAAPDPG